MVFGSREIFHRSFFLWVVTFFLSPFPQSFSVRLSSALGRGQTYVLQMQKEWHGMTSGYDAAVRVLR